MPLVIDDNWQMILIGIGGLVCRTGFVPVGPYLGPLFLAHGINDSPGFVALYAA